MNQSNAICRTVASLALVFSFPLAIAAQQPPPPITATLPEGLVAGQCNLTVKLSGVAPAGTVVQLRLNNNANGLPETPAGGLNEVKVRLKGPLGEGDRLQVRVPPGDWSNAVGVGAGTKPECQATDAAADDGREPFQPSGYIGTAFDGFAPAAVGGYKNSQGSGVQNKRYVGGVDFDFRFLGESTSDRQLWIFGETVYGVRSADVNCQAADKPPVCGTLLQNPDQQLIFIVDHASSLEAFLGARWELLTLQRGTSSPTKFYVTGQLGVVMLDGQASAPTADPNNRKVVDIRRAYREHHVGAGWLAPSGSFAGSYLEIGWGITDLFNTDPDGKVRWNRLKVDAHLSFPLSIPFTGMKWTKGPRVFAQLFSDFDPSHKSSDSMQTFIGLDFDVRDLFK